MAQNNRMKANEIEANWKLFRYNTILSNNLIKIRFALIAFASVFFHSTGRTASTLYLTEPFCSSLSSFN